MDAKKLERLREQIRKREMDLVRIGVTEENLRKTLATDFGIKDDKAIDKKLSDLSKQVEKTREEVRQKLNAFDEKYGGSCDEI